MNIKGWLHLRSTGLISLLSKEFSGVFFSTTVWRHQFFHILPSLPDADDMVLYIENPKDSTQKLLDPINEFNKICWIIKKARTFQKNIYFCFIDYAKALDCMDHNKLWRILKEMGIPDHLTCLLRNLYAGQEVTVRTGHGTTDWFQKGKGVHRGCILSPCLFNSVTWNMQMTPPLWQKVKRN